MYMFQAKVVHRTTNMCMYSQVEQCLWVFVCEHCAACITFRNFLIQAKLSELGHFLELPLYIVDNAGVSYLYSAAQTHNKI